MALRVDHVPQSWRRGATQPAAPPIQGNRAAFPAPRWHLAGFGGAVAGKRGDICGTQSRLAPVGNACENPAAPAKRHAVVKKLVRFLIRGYQWMISPMIHFVGGPGTGCRFTPTCSQYFLEAVERHGVWRGGWMGIKRICRCHPWGKTGYDPVPGGEDAKDATHCACHSAASGHKSPPASSQPGQPHS